MNYPLSFSQSSISNTNSFTFSEDPKPNEPNGAVVGLRILNGSANCADIPVDNVPDGIIFGVPNAPEIVSHAFTHL